MLLINDDYKIEFGSKRDKNNAVFSVARKGNYSFLTLLEPFGGDKNNLMGSENGEQWLIQDKSPNISTDASIILTSHNMTILINCMYINYKNIDLEIDFPATMVLKFENDKSELLYLGRKNTKIIKMDKNKVKDRITDDILSPGERIGFN